MAERCFVGPRMVKQMFVYQAAISPAPWQGWVSTCPDGAVKAFV
jgi:hypothetical protein